MTIHVFQILKQHLGQIFGHSINSFCLQFTIDFLIRFIMAPKT